MGKVRRVDFYPDEFITGTLSLNCEQKGAYWIICSLIYSGGGPIPDDGQWLSKVCGLSSRRWPAVRESLIACGKVEIDANGHLMNARCAKELAETSRRIDAASANGRKGGRPSGATPIEVDAKSSSSADQGAVDPEINRTSGALHAVFKEDELSKNNDIPKATGLSSEKLTITTTITNTNTNNNNTSAAPKGAEDAFEKFWVVYPSRGGATNPKKPARISFAKAVKSGIAPEVIIAGATAYAQESKRAVTEPKFIKQAVTWLNQNCWEQYAEKPATNPSTSKQYADDFCRETDELYRIMGID